MLNLSHSSVHNSGDSGRIVVQQSSDAELEVIVDVQQYYTEWEYKLKQIYYHERIALVIIFYVVTTIAIIGNILTLYVVITRKQRLLFKTCLLSLALSDLIYAITCGANYISKLHHEMSALWYLGEFLCSFLPFFQTTSLLSGSMSLVSIAIDRYMAIFVKRKGQWQPGFKFCAIGFTFVWSISAALSSPMLFSYSLFDVYVVPEIQENYYLAHYCIVDSKDESRYYYSVLFIFVFLPMLVAFIAFNAIIAREIWKKRKTPGSKCIKPTRNYEDSSSSTTEVKNSSNTNSTGLRNNSGQSKDTSTDSKSGTVTISQQQPQIFITQIQQHQSHTHQHQMHNNDRRNERQCRQMRMFKVILVLMCVFIVLRLPNWIFLLYKLYNFVPTDRAIWLLNYAFCISGIMNSMANPFLYTFLSETILFTSYIRITCYKFCKLRRPKVAQSNYANNATMFAKNEDLNKPKIDNGGVYVGN
ncbi:neuropeptide Y receptor type 5-like [Chironomus tepperi]|uniref:neuropeptide Y receptor type 5-like n=1 Tax=Chironomus tepperi TaxID=113505 RepID=UPI00391F0B49